MCDAGGVATSKQRRGLAGGPAPRFRQRFDRAPEPVQIGDRSVRLVVCPRCRGCARLVEIAAADGRRRRVSCGACGAAQDDPPPLRWWLRIACCGHVLWATSADHLRFLAAYVASPLRERLRQHWPDRELLARLPRWLIAARNRDAVLRCIARLEQTLPAEP